MDYVGEVVTAEAITTQEPTYKDGSPVEPTLEEDAPPAEPAWEEDIPLVEPAWEEYAPPFEESTHEDAPSVQGPPYEEEGLPVDEIAFAEDAHRVEAPATGLYSSAAKALPIEGFTEAVQTHLVRVSVKDLALYMNWEKLFSNIKASRVRKLTAKGLPTPSEDGLVSIFVAGVRT
jgi:hypothetical protein